MKLMRWNPSPSRDLVTFHEELTRLFDDVFARGSNDYAPASSFVPALDVEETTDAFEVRVDLPGLSKDEVKVSITDGVLSIAGERRRSREHDSDNPNLRRTERIYGAFERRIELDAPVRADKVKATYRDGVLDVHVPKAEGARVHQIEVQGG